VREVWKSEKLLFSCAEGREIGKFTFLLCGRSGNRKNYFFLLRKVGKSEN